MTDYLLKNFGSVRLTESVDSDDTTFTVSAADAAKLPEPGVGEAFALTLWDGQGEPEIVYCTSNALTGVLVVSRGEEGSTPRAWLAGTEARNSLTAATTQNLLQTGFISGNAASEAEAQAGTSNAKLMTPLRATDHFNARTTSITRDMLLLADVEALRSFLGFATATFSGTGLEDTFEIEETNFDPQYVKVYVDEVYQDSGYTINGNEIDGYEIVFDSPPAAGSDNIVLVLGVSFAFSVSYPGDNTVDTAALVDSAVETAKINNLAVTTAKIASGAVTDAKLASNAVTNTKILDNTIAGAKLADGAVDLTSAKVTGTLPSAKVPAASETAVGGAELATQSETNTGSDDARIVTPLKLKTKLTSSYRYIGRQVFTSNGNYTPTAGTTLIRVRMVGGGGGGGGARATDSGEGSAAAGSGGSAAEGKEFDMLVSALSPPVAITVGAGGTPGANTGGDGGDGGVSSFGSHATCDGGKGGDGIGTGDYDAGDPPDGGEGGTTPPGGVSFPGGDGAPGMVGDGGAGSTLISTMGGQGGSSLLGFGGKGRHSRNSSNAGGAGQGYGSGGGGACSKSTGGAAGGAGAPGIVIIDEYTDG